MVLTKIFQAHRDLVPGPANVLVGSPEVPRPPPDLSEHVPVEFLHELLVQDVFRPFPIQQPASRFGQESVRCCIGVSASSCCLYAKKQAIRQSMNILIDRRTCSNRRPRLFMAGFHPKAA